MTKKEYNKMIEKLYKKYDNNPLIDFYIEQFLDNLVNKKTRKPLTYEQKAVLLYITFECIGKDDIEEENEK